jgi:hypothetical protein
MGWAQIRAVLSALASVVVLAQLRRRDPQTLVSELTQMGMAYQKPRPRLQLANQQQLPLDPVLSLLQEPVLQSVVAVAKQMALACRKRRLRPQVADRLQAQFALAVVPPAVVLALARLAPC